MQLSLPLKPQPICKHVSHPALSIAVHDVQELPEKMHPVSGVHWGLENVSQVVHFGSENPQPYKKHISLFSNALQSVHAETVFEYQHPFAVHSLIGRLLQATQEVPFHEQFIVELHSS